MSIEVMEKKLYNACLKGDVHMLEALTREDELILARISLSSCFNQTPLHLACMLGHFELAKSLLSYKPDFATRLDAQGRSPLHLASANGYVGIVKLLLQHDGKVVRVCDEDGRTPLHLAVMNGQQECVGELMKVDGEEIGTALHLCVMCNRLDVLDVILKSTEQDVLNLKDEKGNTVLHSATLLRRTQIIKYLLMTKSEVLKVNTVNENSLTALDIVEQMPQDVKTMEIKELLVSAGTRKAQELKPADQSVQEGDEAAKTGTSNSKCLKIFDKFTKFTIFRETREARDDALLVAASVIAAMAYTAAISPPGGVASMDAKEFPPLGSPGGSPDSLKDKYFHLNPAASLLAYFNPNLSYTFWISNNISFMASLSVIFLYVSGSSLKRRFFTWLIRGAMWVTLTSMTIAYVCAVSATTGATEDYNALYPLVFGLLAWGILVFVTFLVLVYRFQRYIIPAIKRQGASMNKNISGDSATTSKSSNSYIV
ncbi:ankyrin repeat-containing protein At2g01680-like [Daucus carota subsp. sativus]|nr:PREDICTED: ankyrin repeat-containing protein At2g01680-like [Daucus carota subsp. sativus]